MEARIAFRLPHEHARAMDRLALAKGMTVSELMRRAVEILATEAPTGKKFDPSSRPLNPFVAKARRAQRL